MSHSNFDGVADAIVLVVRIMGLRLLWKLRVEYLRIVDMVLRRRRWRGCGQKYEGFKRGSNTEITAARAL